MASTAITRGRGQVQSRGRGHRDMVSPPTIRSSSQDTVQVDECVKFLELRKTLSRLRSLIYSTDTADHSRQGSDNQSTKQEIQTLADTLEVQFDNICRQMTRNRSECAEGQNSIKDGVMRVEGLVRQRSEEDQQVIRNLRATLEEQNRVNSQLQIKLEVAQKEICDLKGKVQASDSKPTAENDQMKEMRDSVADLKQQVRLLTEIPNRAPCGSGPRHGQRLWSFSCQELDTGDQHNNVSERGSCLTLNDLDDSRDNDEEDVAHGYEQGQRGLSRSTTTIDTKDTGFSDTSFDATEVAIRILNMKVDKLLRSAASCPKPSKSGPELPVFIRGFCVNIQEAVFSADRSRINQFSRSLGVESSRLKSLKDELDYDLDLPSLFWAVIYEWNTLCEVKHTRATMLNQLIQACDDCRIPNPLDVTPMPTKDRLIIEQNYSFLVEHLMVQPTLVYLRDSQFITASIVTYVSEPRPVPEQVLRLVDILPVCGHAALDIFLTALRQSQQNHIADGIVQSNPDRFKGSNTCMVPAVPLNEKYAMFPRQNIKPKKKKRFDWKKPFRILTKSKSYKLDQDME